MNIYTYSEARQKLSSVLDSAKQSGKVLIKRRDGSIFSLTPEIQPRSPLDIEGIKTDISTKEIVSFVRESRRAKPPLRNH
jgi:antitoxin Phd